MTIRQELRRYIYKLFPKNPELDFVLIRDSFAVGIAFNREWQKFKKWQWIPNAYELGWFYIRIGQL